MWTALYHGWPSTWLRQHPVHPDSYDFALKESKGKEGGKEGGRENRKGGGM